MTSPRLQLQSPSTGDLEIRGPLVLGVSSHIDGPLLHDVLGIYADTPPSLADIGATGALDQLIRIPAPATQPNYGSIALIGLGDTPEDSTALRRASGAAIRQLAGAAEVTLALPAKSAAQLEAILEGAALGGYAFRAYRSMSSVKSKAPVATVTVLNSAAGTPEAEQFLQRASLLAEAAALTKDLVNTPPIDLYPAALADRASTEVTSLPVDVTIWDDHALNEQGFGGIVGVGQGSSRPPRLVKLDYAPTEARQHLALVGKGVTFDTGGLSLKPAASMLGMKYDMTGAATVLAAVIAIARLNLPLRVTGWLCLAENMPSSTAIRPGDVLTLKSGHTVEVTNTDAEGRLVLADGLTAAGEEQPDQIIDIATLTGAAKIAMGTRYVATMGDTDLVQALIAAGKDAGESLWPMPLPAEMRSVLDSEIADIANAKVGNSSGGMLLAGIFLKEFVPKNTETGAAIPWAHLDIANTAWNESGAQGFTAVGPTAVAVRTLVQHAEILSRP